MIKLYALTCGRLRCRRSIFVPTAPKDQFIEPPMPVFLLAHPRGWVLFDTGPNPEVFLDPSGVWGGLAKAFIPIGDERSGVTAQLDRLGLSPQDIGHVVNSHLHFDHAGGNRFFPGATFWVAEQEFSAARNPDLEGKGYIRADWDLAVNFQYVTGEKDLFGDGRLVILPLPGHTPGHQGLLIRLNQTAPLILAADAAPSRDNLEQLLLGRNNMDEEQAKQTLILLRELASQEKATLIYGHDADQWSTLKQAPDYYS